MRNRTLLKLFTAKPQDDNNQVIPRHPKRLTTLDKQIALVAAKAVGIVYTAMLRKMVKDATGNVRFID